MGQARRKGTRLDRVKIAREANLKLAINEYGGSIEQLKAFIAHHWWVPPKTLYRPSLAIATMYRRRPQIEKFCDKLGLDYPEKEDVWPKCPHCQKFYPKDFHAYSRADNETKICSECGTSEALADDSSGLNPPGE